MAKVSKTYRFDEALVTRVAAYASARRSTATDVFAAGAELLLGMAEGGVPDLPAAGPLDRERSALPRIVRASQLSPPSDEAMARQARLNRARS